MLIGRCVDFYADLIVQKARNDRHCRYDRLRSGANVALVKEISLDKRIVCDKMQQDGNCRQGV